MNDAARKPKNLAESLPPGAGRVFAALHDAVMAAVSFVLALYLRFGGEQFAQSRPYLAEGTLLFTLICAGVFWATRLYRGLWRYTSLPDMAAIVRAVTLAVALFSVAMFALTRLEGLPRSVPFINWLLLIALLAGPRIAYRALHDGRLRLDSGVRSADGSWRIPLLLVGATGGADLFIRDCARDVRSLYRVVGVVDDDPHRRGRALHGIRIYGRTDQLTHVVRKLELRRSRPQRLIIADDALPPEKLQAVLSQAEELGLPLGRLPRLGEFKSGAPSGPEIQPIAIEDLLGRAQSLHDRAHLEALVRSKRIAITGAGGSIGAELTRQLAALAPTSLLLIDSSEHFLYLIDHELGTAQPGIPRRAAILDVRDASALNALFADYHPQLVFHAAAIKHVPLSEANPLAAISTNVLGSRNVARAAQAAGAAAMVVVSTDKAVNPLSVMGATKRLAETYCQALGQANESKTHFLTVRFGNVLGSHGSVVPLFTRQIRAGGPVTVTHPDMVRYFMTIREAVELVLHAAALGAALPDRREAIFVLDMGQPMKIIDLAAQMIRLAGLKPHEDIQIAFTGLRPGEKLYEELFYAEERVASTSLSGVLIAQSRPCALAALEAALIALEKHCGDGNDAAALALLSSLVPEFTRHIRPSDLPYATHEDRPRAALRIG